MSESPLANFDAGIAQVAGYLKRELGDMMKDKMVERDRRIQKVEEQIEALAAVVDECVCSLEGKVVALQTDVSDFHAQLARRSDVSGISQIAAFLKQELGGMIADKMEERDLRQAAMDEKIVALATVADDMYDDLERQISTLRSDVGQHLVLPPS